MEKKRILHVNIENSGGNGAFALVNYLYSYMKKDYVFDFFSMGVFDEDDITKELRDSGSRLFAANLRKNRLIGHLLLPVYFGKILKENHYDTIHIHSEVAYKHALFVAAAKKMGVKKIIVHSHSSNVDGRFRKIKIFCHKISKWFINQNANIFLACSDSAARWMFSHKNIRSNRFFLLHNGINVEKYKFDPSVRDLQRRKIGLTEEDFVLIHVGALKRVKNQKFIVEILHTYSENTCFNCKLLLIGDGEDKNDLVEKAKEYGIQDRVLFLGARTDVNMLLQAGDFFVFPSLFEGIPMALIEAQAVGLPALVSDVVNRDIKINDNVNFCSLKTGAARWGELIHSTVVHFHEKGYENVKKSDYNIIFSVKKLSEIYDG